MVTLKHCTFERYEWGATTRFPDGTTVDAIPHDTHHYHVIAHRLGYEDDILTYCQEHELAHSVVAEFFTDTPSDVLWQLAHGKKPNHWNMVAEEMAAQALQRFVRAGERPIISGVDWNSLREVFRAYAS